MPISSASSRSLAVVGMMPWLPTPTGMWSNSAWLVRGEGEGRGLRSGKGQGGAQHGTCWRPGQPALGNTRQTS